jgi:hypothetical protein
VTHPKVDPDGADLETIGRALGVTRERARQIQNLALQHVEAALRERLGDEAVDALRTTPSKPQLLIQSGTTCLA